AEVVGKILSDLPGLLERAEQGAAAFAEMARNGIRLDPETTNRIGAAEARHSRWGHAALWVGALSLLAIAVALIARELSEIHGFRCLPWSDRSSAGFP